MNYSVTFTVDGQGSLTIGDQLNLLTITAGSGDGMDVPQPSQLTASFLIDSTDQAGAFWLGRQIQVAITPTGQAAFDVFWGSVDTINVAPVNTEGTTAIISLTATSQMAKLQNTQVGGAGFTANDEYFRAIELRQEIGYCQWQDVPVGLTWDDLDPTTTWTAFDSTLDRMSFFPYGFGGFNLEAYSSGATDALSFIQDWITGTGAWLFDEPDGSTTYFVAYDDWANVSPITLDVSTCAIWDSLELNNDISNIYTNITFANSSTSASYSNFNQLSAYGDRSVTIESQCADLNDLQTLATGRGIALSAPQAALNTITIDLDLVSYTNMKKMMRFEAPTFWAFTNIPAIFGGNQTYWQAGLNLQLSYYHAEVDLVITPDSVRRGLTQWSEVPFQWLWNNYQTATTTWQQVT